MNLFEDANYLYDAGTKAMNGSKWKYSTQLFEINHLLETAVLQKKLTEKDYHPGRGQKFKICERGKPRYITSSDMVDKTVYHTLSDDVLGPALKPYIIQENTASQKGKGVAMFRRQLENDLRRYYRVHGTNKGYILLTDFSGYYPNMNHDICKKQLSEFLDKSKLDAETITTAKFIIDGLFKTFETDVSRFSDDEIEKMGGHVYKLSFREDLNLPKFQKDLAVFFAQHHEYKIVHCHAYTIGYFCLKAAKKAGIPVRIAHSHNNETVHDIKYLPKLFMQRIFTKNATDLFACSEEAGKYLFKDKPFQVLKNAIDSQNFIADADTRNEIRKELGLKDKFVVGHVGRLHPQKNHDFLIDVFAKIKKKKSDAELILVGTGPLEEKVKSKVAEKGLSDCVHFLGNRKDMNRIYQAMDVFVFPSLFEGLGIVAIEAQAAGVPIVCSEGLPPETDITPIYRKLLLSDGEEKWANAALEMAQNPKAHTNMQQYVIDAGFDMDATAKYMGSYYLRKYN